MDCPSFAQSSEQTPDGDFTSEEPPQSEDSSGPPPLMSQGRRGQVYDLFSNYRRSNAFGNYMGGYKSGNAIENSYGFGPMGANMGGPGSTRGAGGWYRGGVGPTRRGPGTMGFDGPPNMDYNDDYYEMGNLDHIRRMGGPMQSHGPSFNESPYSYLQRCGVRDEEMVNLPREYFMLIEPDRCSVCYLHVDSFAQSRAHYVSRQHWRNTSIWLDQWSEKTRHVAPRHKVKKQAELQPFKARELFCELCNLQLTSKIHADAHYAGKNHRAVVDGRKDPKNKNLLAASQRARYDALIKREKRAIKILMKELETEMEQNPDTAAVEKDAKPADPNLYCEICKSQMGCTEQMTAHLNGKRHLAKEKNHILRMMKGDSEDAEPKRRRRRYDFEEEEDYDEEDGYEENEGVGDNGNENDGGEDDDCQFVSTEADQ